VSLVLALSTCYSRYLFQHQRPRLASSRSANQELPHQLVHRSRLFRRRGTTIGSDAFLTNSTQRLASHQREDLSLILLVLVVQIRSVMSRSATTTFLVAFDGTTRNLAVTFPSFPFYKLCGSSLNALSLPRLTF
jgi:hypothetical protein